MAVPVPHLELIAGEIIMARLPQILARSLDIATGCSDCPSIASICLSDGTFSRRYHRLVGHMHPVGNLPIQMIEHKKLRQSVSDHVGEMLAVAVVERKTVIGSVRFTVGPDPV